MPAGKQEQVNSSDSDELDKMVYDGLAVATEPRAKGAVDIPGSLLQDLKKNLVTRHVSSGFALLDAHSHLFASLDPAQRNAAAMEGHVAQWVDIGYAGPDLVEQLLTRFPHVINRLQPIGQYMQLRQAEDTLALIR